MKNARQVPFQTDVFCPECDGRMRVWREGSNGTDRHFKHVGGMAGGTADAEYDSCEYVAESDKHIKWKNLACNTLHEEFFGEIADLTVEKQLSAPHSDKKHRKGDVVMILSERDDRLGKGLVVEVQHKNNEKNIEQTTADYIRQDLSVVWTFEEDYSDDHCRLAKPDFYNRAKEAVWPSHSPHVSEWRTVDDCYYHLKNEWQNSEDAERFVPAKMPSDWHDEKARQLWLEKSWPSLFTAESAFCRTDFDRFIDETRRTISTTHTRVTLPPDWCDATALDLWNQQDWETLFTTPQSERIDDYSRLEYQSEVFIQQVRDSLSDGVMQISVSSVPETLLRSWFMSGLEKRNEAKNELPPPSDWFGDADLNFEYSAPTVAVKMPEELFYELEEDLRMHHGLGAGKLSLDLLYNLSENNADRTCEACSSRADFYMFREAFLSCFRCSDCADEVCSL
jgi:hypothetical protein